MPPIQQNAAALRQTESADVILNHLTTRQHLMPHASVQDVLAQTVELYGCCPEAVARGIEWLQLDPTVPIGRLRRSEIIQLARAVHRFWMKNKKDEAMGG